MTSTGLTRRGGTGFRRRLGILLIVLVALAGCGGDDSSTDAGGNEDASQAADGTGDDAGGLGELTMDDEPMGCLDLITAVSRIEFGRRALQLEDFSGDYAGEYTQYAEELDHFVATAPADVVRNFQDIADELQPFYTALAAASPPDEEVTDENREQVLASIAPLPDSDLVDDAYDQINAWMNANC